MKTRNSTLNRISTILKIFGAVEEPSYNKSAPPVCLILIKLILVVVLFYLCISSVFLLLINSQSQSEPTAKDQFSVQFFRDSSLYNYSKNLSNGNSKWVIPKKIWIYDLYNKTNQSQQMRDFEFLNLMNTRHKSKIDNFELFQINQTSLNNYISQESRLKLSKILENLQLKLNDSTNSTLVSQLSQNLPQIKRRLIVYFVLLQNGGVFIDSSMTILEKFSDWLQDVMNSPYINVGDKFNSTIKPECFGFFIRNFGSMKIAANVKRQFDFQKKLIIFPSIDDRFLACHQNTQYLKDLVQIYTQFLIQGNKSQKWMSINKDQNLIGMTEPDSFYRQGHLLANHYVLQKRQKILDQQGGNSYRKFAIDDYGLVSFDSNLGPTKLHHYFLEQNSEKCAIYLSKLTISELEHLVGKLRFVFMLRERVVLQIIYKLQKPKDSVNFFVESSFVHRYFLANLFGQTRKNREGFLITKKISNGQRQLKLTFSQVQIRPTPIEQKQSNKKKEWSSIPKKAFMIWDTGLVGNSSFLSQLCTENIRRSLKRSGFQLIIIQQSNVKNFISPGTLSKIDYAMKHASMQIFKPTISDMWRLALIMQHGGIYLDSTTFTLQQSYDWLLHITSIPSSFIWNRYGHQPCVFMFWNLHFKNQNWVIDQGTKSALLLSYQSGFIAAVKDSELMRDWFNQFMDWLVAPYESIQKQMQEVGMINYRWTNPTSKYLMIMDAIKYVLCRKQLFLHQTKNSVFKTASDYYKIWSFPGQMIGQLKFRLQSNLELEDFRQRYHDQHTIYRFEYPLQYYESIDGQVLFQSKFFCHGHPMDSMLRNFYHFHKKQFKLQTFWKIVHPESLLGKILLRKYQAKTLFLLQYYDKLLAIRMKYKGRSMLGF